MLSQGVGKRIKYRRTKPEVVYGKEKEVRYMLRMIKQKEL